jgi:cytochrome c-type biogenesis protein CcmH
MKRLAFAFLASFFLVGSVAAQPAQPVEDPQLDQRMQNFTQQLRCMVCRNETLADSQADVAADLRREIRKQMKDGKTDQEILAFLTQRYGDYVLYNPPVKPKTYPLWFFPFILFTGGIVFLYWYLRRRRDVIHNEPLTAEEQQRAEELLRG